MTKNLFSIFVDHLFFIYFTQKLLTCHLFSLFNKAFLWNNTHRDIRVASNTVWFHLLQSCAAHCVSGLWCKSDDWEWSQYYSLSLTANTLCRWFISPIRSTPSLVTHEWGTHSTCILEFENARNVWAQCNEYTVLCLSCIHAAITDWEIE